MTLPRAAQVVVSVFNGTGRDGVARSVQAQLQALGLSVPTIDTAPATIIGVAQIQHGPSGKSAATLVSFYFPGSKLVTTNRADARVDVVLGTGFSKLATKNQVAAKVAAAGKKC